MFQHIDLVVGGFSLAAFAIASILALTRHALNREKQLIETASDEQKARLVEQALNKYHVPSDDLNTEQKYQLIVAGMQDKSRFWNKLFLFMLSLALIAALLTIALVSMRDTPVNQVDYLQQTEFKQAQAAYFEANDDELAYTLYLQAAQKNNPFAMAALAKLFFTGRGVLEDNNKAQYWAKKAFSELRKNEYKNIGWAEYSLGYLHNKGIGAEPDTKKAIDLYTAASYKDVAIASNNVSQIFLTNPNHKDLKKGFGFLQDAERQSDPTNRLILVNLGNYYYESQFGAQDYVKSAQYYEQAADMGSIFAMQRAGYLAFVQQKPPDFEKAHKYLKQATKNDSNLAAVQLAILLLEKDFKDANPQQALALLTAQSDNKYGFATYRLAALYRMSQAELDQLEVDLTHSNTKAVELYHLASEQGEANASFSLGFAYETGSMDIEANSATAFKYYELAYNQGRKDAAFYIGKHYHYSEARQNYSEAISWYKKAIDAGDFDAYKNLLAVYKSDETLKDADTLISELIAQAKLVENQPTLAIRLQAYVHANSGNDPQEHEKAQALYEKAIALGSKVAVYELGRLYNHNDWQPQQGNHKALEYFKQASEYNHCAENYVGYYYEMGKVGEPDMVLALKHYKNAAQSNNPSGLYNYGRFLATGKGGKLDTAAAVGYLKRAKMLGIKSANLTLFELYSNVNNPEYDITLAKKYFFEIDRENTKPEKLDEAMAKLLAQQNGTLPATCSAG